MNTSSPQASLEITASTWSRETHGLFDYESKTLHRNYFNVSESCKMFRLKDDCYMNQVEDNTGSTLLLSLEKKNTEFQVTLMDESINNKMWLVIKDLKQRSSLGYKLKEGDLVKIGRVKMRVQRICMQPLRGNASILPDFFKGKQENAELGKETSVDGTETQEKSACRICLNEVETVEDPLISPCKCAGTMKFIHLNCLKEWLRSKVSSNITEKGMSFHIKDLTCELCKSDFPVFVSHNDTKINLLNITFPTKSYIIVEEYKPDRNSKTALHLISLETGQHATLGRGHNCDIKISDISVSRKHCKILLSNGEFYIEDTKSKFGTLAKIKNSFTLKASYDVSIQINRTVFRLFYRIPWSCKDFCGCMKGIKVFNANMSYLTQPEIHESESELMNFSSSLGQHQNIDQYVE